MPTLTRTKTPKIFESLAGANVDAEKGIIFGVAVISMGPALGHGIEIDRKGLLMSLKCLEAQGPDGVRLLTIHDGEVDEIAGAVKDFRIDGDKVLGDLYIFENYPGRASLLEKAIKLPKGFGLSIESFGTDEPRDGGGHWFRPSEIDAVALTPRPAANRTGLFGRRVDTRTHSKSMAKKFSKTFLAACEALRKKFEGDVVPDAEELADAITEAVQEAVEPAVETAVAEQTGDVVKSDGDEIKDLQARLKKLEDGNAAPSDEEKKKLAEEEETKLSRVATDAVKKFAAEIGVKKAPSSTDPERGKKSNFESAVEAQMTAGAKSRGAAIARVAADKPELYNAAIKNGEI